MTRRERRERRRREKAVRRLAAARRAQAGGRLTILPPEGVPLHFRVAGIGARLGAQLLDLAVTLAFAILLGVALSFGFDLGFQTAVALVSLLAFLARTPYYVAFELLWNGRTPAKRWLGLRTVSRDGRGLAAYQIVVRNLMREIEFFTPATYLLAGFAQVGWFAVLASVWVLILVIVPWRSPTNQRLGDMIAGTAVIEEPKVALAGDIAAGAGGDAERFTFTTAQLDAYGAYELQVLERMLRPAGKLGPQARRKREAQLGDIAGRIRAKIGHDEPVAHRETEAFLRAFYRAQRAYLESRKLFGDARQDKTYRESEDV